jgi:hypothetical protein
MEQFEDLQAWDLMVESRQYRANGGRGLNLRNVADFAFLDLLSLFILHSEYETAPIASKYADSTIGYRNFAKARLSGTDLYVSMNILSDPTSVFSSKIAQNADADAILRGKLKVNLPTVKRYLDTLADGTITKDDAATLFLRLEKQLNITDSKLRSIRRLVQDWPGLNTMQRELATTKMLQYYKKFAKRSEMSVFLSDLAKGKGYEMRGGIDAELANLGYTGRDAKGADHHDKHDKHGPSWSKIASDLMPAAGFYAGYKLAKR